MPVRNTTNWDPARKWLVDTSFGAVRAAAMHCAVQAMKYAPKDTGHLRSSINVIDSNDETISTVYVGAFYAVFVEYGHHTPNGGWVSPNPFLRLALADTAQAWPQIVQDMFANAEEAYNARADGIFLGAEFHA